jgi:hypothetical protein
MAAILFVAELSLMLNICLGSTDKNHDALQLMKTINYKFVTIPKSLFAIISIALFVIVTHESKKDIERLDLFWIGCAFTALFVIFVARDTLKGLRDFSRSIEKDD